MSKEYENLKKQRCLQLVQECARSGKSKREWCAENGIGYFTFMRWQKRLREKLAGAVLASQEIGNRSIIPPGYRRAGECETIGKMRQTRKAVSKV